MLKKLALGILIAGVAPSALANLSEIDLGNELQTISSPKNSCSQALASFCGSQFNSTDLASKTDSALSLRNIATSVLANSPFLTCNSKAYPESSASIYPSNYRQSQLEESQSNIFFRPGTKDSLLSLNTIAQPDCNFAWQQRLERQLVTLELSKAASFTVRQDNPQERQVKQNFPTLSRSSLVVSFPQTNSTFIPHQIKLANPAPETERIASPFGWRNRPYSNQRQFHQGIDYGAPYGSPVVSIGNGIVTKVVKGCADFGNLFCGGQLGNWIEIDHGNGQIGTYGHLKYNSITVTEGMKVSRDLLIAQVGSSGWSTGAHLDFRLKVNGKHENPAKYVMEIDRSKEESLEQ